MNGLMTVAEAAGFWGVSQPQMRRWAEKGIVAAGRTPGGQWRFDPEVMEQTFRQTTGQGENPKPNCNDCIYNIETLEQ